MPTPLFNAVFPSPKKQQYLLFAMRPKPVAVKNCLDKYSMEFIYSLFHTENCYECHYADTQRISDITIGDSWGSELSEDDI